MPNLIRPVFRTQTTEDIVRRDRKRALLITALAVVVTLAAAVAGHLQP